MSGAVETQANRLRAWRAPLEWFTALFVVLTVLSVGLPLVSLAAVMRRQVTLRGKELGVRLALGATPGRLARWVLTRGILVAGAGAVAGLAGARWMWDMVRARLSAPVEGDLVLLGILVVSFALLALLSVWGPARRAGRLEPRALWGES